MILCCPYLLVTARLVSRVETLVKKGKLMSTRYDRNAVAAGIAPLDPRPTSGDA